MDSPIADRARGCLLNPDFAAVETIARHVERVVRRTDTRSAIDKLLHELEDEVEARRVARLAKSILQSTGMTQVMKRRWTTCELSLLPVRLQNY